MKKRFIKISLLVFGIFLCTACNGTITRDIRHAGFSVSSDFVCDNFYPKDKEDVTYERIRYFTSNHIITDTGKIYEISLGQVYANNKNCKEADTSLVVKAIFDDKIIKASDNKYYYLIPDNNVVSYSQITTADNSYAIYDMLLRDDDVVKVVTADGSNGTYYVLKSDGNIYSKVISSENRNEGPRLVSTQIVFDKYSYDGTNIIDFDYAGNSLSTFIRTENKVYRMRITNREECSKYADIECQYSMKEDPIFEQYKDKIISYNGSLLITNYKRTFQVAY